MERKATLLKAGERNEMLSCSGGFPPVQKAIGMHLSIRQLSLSCVHGFAQLASAFNQGGSPARLNHVHTYAMLDTFSPHFGLWIDTSRLCAWGYL